MIVCDSVWPIYYCLMKWVLFCVNNIYIIQWDGMTRLFIIQTMCTIYNILIIWASIYFFQLCFAFKGKIGSHILLTFSYISTDFEQVSNEDWYESEELSSYEGYVYDLSHDHYKIAIRISCACHMHVIW